MHTEKEGFDLDQLITEAMRGDDQAFYRLISQYREQMYRIAYSYFHNEHDSLEAVQEATCRAYMKLRKLKVSQYFGTWLIRILMNYCMDEVKRRLRRKDEQMAVIAAELNHMHHSESAMLNKILLESAVDQLDENYQHIVQLKYYHDLSISEIAWMLDKPAGTIKTWLHKALGDLRRQLKRDGEHHV